MPQPSVRSVLPLGLGLGSINLQLILCLFCFCLWFDSVAHRAREPGAFEADRDDPSTDGTVRPAARAGVGGAAH